MHMTARMAMAAGIQNSAQDNAHLDMPVVMGPGDRRNVNFGC
jgi:hypothetical protein